MTNVSTDEISREQRLQQLTLLATSISYVLVILDTSIVNVALDDISQGLATDVTGLQWVVTAYVAVFASLVLTGGALGDIFGARRVYLFGLMLFTFASLIMGLAPSLGFLVAGRILQGVGAALLAPCALSLLATVYRDTRARAKAIASWTAWGGAAQVLGPLAGGMLLVAFDWRAIFLVNVPLGLVGIWLTLRIDVQPGGRRGTRLDLPGQLTATFAMLLLIGALIQGSGSSWGRPWIVAMLVLASLLALVFVAIERRSAWPMLPLGLFSNPVVAWMTFARLFGAAVFFGMLFVWSLYFLQDAGYSPLRTGMAMMPLALFATIGNLASARLAARFDPYGIMIAGTVVRLIGFAVVIFAIPGPSYALMLIPLVLIGFGSGLGNPMGITIVLSAVDRRYSGVASGLSTATGQLGAALGVAVLGSLLVRSSRVADGAQIGAVVAVAITSATILIFWWLWQYSKDQVASLQQE